jgi:hypothetical protein
MEATITEMKMFEDRIVVLIEKEDPSPGVDIIAEMRNRTL